MYNRILMTKFVKSSIVDYRLFDKENEQSKKVCFEDWDTQDSFQKPGHFLSFTDLSRHSGQLAENRNCPGKTGRLVSIN